MIDVKNRTVLIYFQTPTFAVKTASGVLAFSWHENMHLGWCGGGGVGGRGGAGWGGGDSDVRDGHFHVHWRTTLTRIQDSQVGNVEL